jgi:hypothetical protein
MKVYQVITHDEEQQTIGVFSTIDLAKQAIIHRWNLLTKSHGYVNSFDALMSIEELEIDNPEYETSNMIYVNYGYNQGLNKRKNAELLARKRGKAKS